MDSQNNLGQFIKERRREKKLSLRELGELSGLSRAYLSILERGSDIRTGNPVKPTLAALQKLAKGLDVSLGELINASNSDELIDPAGASPFSSENIRMIPVLGSISAGKPDAAEHLIDAYWPMDMRLLQEHCTREEIEKAFFLSVKGNSMQPYVSEGDMVLIVPQKVENGDVALVMFNNHDACLRVVNYTPDDKIVLMSANPDYLPVSFSREECRIIGRAMLYMGLFRRRIQMQR